MILLWGSGAAAQQPDLDDLGKHLSGQVSKAGVERVVVADFVSENGEVSPEGHFLAGELSQSLSEHKKKFDVIGSRQLSAALASAQIQPKALNAADSLQRLGGLLYVDAVVTGTLEATPKKYSVRVSLRSIKDGGVIGSGEESVTRPAIADGMALLASKAQPGQLLVADQDGVGIPSCEYCPPPSYTDEARGERLQGNVVLVIVVTSEGRSGQSVVIKSPDTSLAKRATEAVTKWKFKAATDKDGKPVSVLLPVEVTFRLYGH